MNQNKKTISATGKKDKITSKIIVKETFIGTKPLREIIENILLSEIKNNKS